MAKLKSLPLPLSWVSNKIKEEEDLHVRDSLLDGSVPAKNTKKFLRERLFRSGWDPESFTPKKQAAARSSMTEHTPGIRHQSTRELDGLCTELCNAGIPAVPKNTNLYMSSLWESLTHNPWWLPTDLGPKHLVLCGHDNLKLQSASAAFMEDLWSGLSDGRVNRYPSFRRMDLLTLMDPAAMNGFLEETKKDILVLTGGLLDSDSLYHNFSYLSAIRTSFSGFIVFEMIVPDGIRLDAVVGTAHKTGFSNIIGV